MRKLVSAAFFFLLAAPVAWGFEAVSPVTDSISVLNSLKVLWDRTANNPDDEFWGIVNRLSLDVVKGPVLVGLRYDVDAAFDENGEYVRYRPRKYRLQVSQREIAVHLGDFYASLGRGVLLNVLKNDEFGEDTSIQGQKLELVTDYVSFRGLAGIVNPGDPIRFLPAQAEEPDIDYADRDIVWGAETVVSWPGVVSVGGRYVGAVLRTDPESADAQFEQDDLRGLYGVSLEFPDIAGYASFYAEYAWLGLEDRRQEGIPDETAEGRALYFNFTLFVENFDLLIEGKDYYRAEFAYAEGPSLEYQKEVFDLPHYDDEIGARGRAGYRFPEPRVYVFVNYLHTMGHERMPGSLDGHYDQGNEFEWTARAKHVFGGVEKDFAHAAFLDAVAGYREEIEGRWLHASLDAGGSILPDHAVQGLVQWRQFQGMGLQRDVTYGSELFQIGYSWSPWLTLTGQYEHSNEPLAGSTGGSQTGAGDLKENFVSVEATVRPHEAVTVSAFWGSVRGGLKCSGGICRMVPSFEGMKVDVSVRF